MRLKAHFVALSMITSTLQCVTSSNWGRNSAKPSLFTSPKRSRKCKYKLLCAKKSSFPQIMMILSIPIRKKTTSTIFPKLMKLSLKLGSTVRTPKVLSLKKKKRTCLRKKPLKSILFSNTLGLTPQSNGISC